MISRFDFVNPSKVASPKKTCVTIDSDGDSEVVRKNQLNRKEEVLLIGMLIATVCYEFYA